MWIQIKHGEHRETINAKNIVKICLVDATLFINYSDEAYSAFHFSWDTEALAWYEGLQLALQGMDFIVDNDDANHPSQDYIKPLMASKNESLYRYMMYKEALSDNK